MKMSLKENSTGYKQNKIETEGEKHGKTHSGETKPLKILVIGPNT